MNERIKQLARTAGLAYAEDFGGGFPDIKYPPGTEKFAELVIHECATVVDEKLLFECLMSPDPDVLLNNFFKSMQTVPVTKPDRARPTVLSNVSEGDHTLPSSAEQYVKAKTAMITASQAKALYDQSGAEVNLYIKHNVEPKVVEASTSGKRIVHIHLGCVGTFESLDQKLTPTEKGVLDKLKELGYTARVEKQGQSHVPRGQQDDEGNGPKVTNFGITVGW